MKKGKEKRRKITENGKKALKMHLFAQPTINLFVVGNNHLKRGKGIIKMHNIYPWT